MGTWAARAILTRGGCRALSDMRIRVEVQGLFHGCPEGSKD